MANPTTNFGWQMPTSSDLVTDLPADFEVFGQAVDTALVDLKGGTTGQVLSKTSNTDMDFTWVTTDDANAIQNAIVDAKGDLIAASANDTPARLAVGSDYGFLQALASAGSTGLQYGFGLTAYTPVVQSSTGSITSYTANGYWLRVGKLVFVTYNIKITNNGTGAGNLEMSLPFTNGANVRATGTYQETDVVGSLGYLYVPQSTAAGILTTLANAYGGATGYRLQGQVFYEVA